ncbi:MAG: pyridoxamine 5'-phosphate oxidase family protein [Rhodobacteraceae bacterium]|nr:pyridoxamine 5'-phosphate oxidase family protein [Paracoccaceae bacterium]
MNDRNDLAGFLDTAWDIILRALRERGMAERHISLATVSPEGRPEVRTVVMRAADRTASLVTIHTDPTTAKVRALRQTPWAEMMIWSASAQIQIRLRAEVRIATGADAAADWGRVPAASRSSYGTTPAPGTPIADADAYRKPGDPAGFAVLQCQLDRIDLVDLNEPHRRAIYHRADDWRGQWCAP